MINSSVDLSGSILLVDDERDIAHVFKMGLESGAINDGLAVHVFTDPILALEDFQKNPHGYALVISDIRMPGMSGFQLIREIRKLNPSVRVILMSSFELTRAEIAKELGFEAAFMQKPIRISELRDVVLTYLVEPSEVQSLL